MIFKLLFVLLPLFYCQNERIIATGATFPAPVYKSLALLFQAETGFSLSYTGLGSSEGKCRVLGTCSLPISDPVQVDWAGTDSIYSTSDYLTSPDVQLYPSLAGAIVPAYNIAGINDLVLTPEVLADIFRACAEGKTCAPGWISYWNDSRIVNLNPGKSEQLVNAGRIQVIVRAEDSGTTEVWKNSLAFYGTEFASQMINDMGTSSSWRNTSFLFANKNEGVAELVKITSSSIGYVTLSAASFFELNYAGVGTSFLSTDGVLRATPETVERAMFEKGLDFGNNNDLATHFTANIFGTSGSESYPFSSFTYFTVRKNVTTSSCKQRAVTFQWFNWFYRSEGAANLILQSGFQPLPAILKGRLLSALQRDFLCSDGSSAKDYPLNVTSTIETRENNLQEISISYPEESRPALVSLLSSTFPQSSTNVFTSTTDRTGNSSSPVQYSTRLDNSTTRLQFPLLGIPWGVIYNFCGIGLAKPCTNSQFSSLKLALSLDVILEIFAGKITRWNDPKIYLLQETTSQQNLMRLGLNETIRVLSFDSNSYEFTKFKNLLALEGKTFYVNTSIAESSSIRSSSEMLSKIGATQFSIGFQYLSDATESEINRNARFVRSDADGIKHYSDISLMNEWGSTCLVPGTNFNTSNPACWPLISTLVLSIPSTLTNAECESKYGFEIAVLAQHIILTEEITKQVGVWYAQEASNLDRLYSLSCFGYSILNPQENKQLLPDSIYRIIQVVVSIPVLFLIGFIFLVIKNRSNVTNFLLVIQSSFGAMLQISTLFPLVVQDEYYQQQKLDSSCNWVPWLFCLGFALAFGPLLAKIWRFHFIIHRKDMKIMKKTWYFGVVQNMIVLTPVVIILISWQVIDPMTFHRFPIKIDENTGKTLVSVGVCASKNILNYVIPLIVCLFLFLTGTLSVAWYDRFHAGQYVQVRALVCATLAFLLALLLGVPLIILTSNDVYATFAMKGVFIVFTTISTMATFVIPTVGRIYNLWSSEKARSTTKKEGEKVTKGAKHSIKVEGGRESDQVVIPQVSSRNTLQETAHEITSQNSQRIL